ncbi:MAG: hypothetical protein K0S12_575 [Bacteroidetes bacterium]|jgi:hypothetical protein|nr:hypothetical protein [Bacteroidota bacterium]
MKSHFLYFLLILTLSFFSCNKDKEQDHTDFHRPEWGERKIKDHVLDSLKKTNTYLPVYAQIYEVSEERKINLAATVSIRNTDLKDTIYISRIDYYNTEGHLIRQYLSAPVYVLPMETLEIIIKSADNAGGTGANFLFEWYSENKSSDAIFEAVMISTTAQQGISFTSRGVDIN